MAKKGYIIRVSMVGRERAPYSFLDMLRYSGCLLGNAKEFPDYIEYWVESQAGTQMQVERWHSFGYKADWRKE